MRVMLIAKFDGDVEQLRQAYDRAHALIMSSGGATGAGELRHHCAMAKEPCTSSVPGSPRNMSVRVGPARSLNSS